MSSPRLRPARSTDADAIAVLIRTSKAAAMPWLRVPHTLDEDREWVAGVLLPDHTVVVAEVGSGLVGVCATSPGWLNHLYVAPGSQGRGIGRALLEQARRDRPEGLQLWAFTRNAAARRFYERAGFVLVESTDGAGNEEQEPDVRYVSAGGPA